jgi:hypothetical protein
VVGYISSREHQAWRKNRRYHPTQKHSLTIKISFSFFYLFISLFFAINPVVVLPYGRVCYAWIACHDHVTKSFLPNFRTSVLSGNPHQTKENRALTSSSALPLSAFAPLCLIPSCAYTILPLEPPCVLNVSKKGLECFRPAQQRPQPPRRLTTPSPQHSPLRLERRT